MLVKLFEAASSIRGLLVREQNMRRENLITFAGKSLLASAALLGMPTTPA